MLLYRYYRAESSLGARRAVVGYYGTRNRGLESTRAADPQRPFTRKACHARERCAAIGRTRLERGMEAAPTASSAPRRCRVLGQASTYILHEGRAEHLCQAVPGAGSHPPRRDGARHGLRHRSARRPARRGRLPSDGGGLLAGNARRHDRRTCRARHRLRRAQASQLGRRLGGGRHP